MADHFVRAGRTASSTSLAELHQLCANDYTSAASRRAQDHRDDAHLIADPRCPAALPTDPTPCPGPIAVLVLDARNAGAKGCEHHAARLLAVLPGGRPVALPDAPEGAALRTFTASGDIRRGEGQ
ncbi:hypothetical protein [Streptomyces chartreusis]|uniref:hypothetical protein n=1 Tax=Streptomyces chartreusis TaxID=1969 RepID=UPI00362621E8